MVGGPSTWQWLEADFRSDLDDGTLATSKGFSLAAGGALHRLLKIGSPIGPRLSRERGLLRGGYPLHYVARGCCRCG